MIKTYKSATDVYINVKLSSGKFKHIGFMPLTRNGSIFTTDNKELQEGIEKHPGFGKMFHLSDTQTKSKTQSVSNTQTSESRVTKVKVSDIEDAKDYMAETFGISRTMMRTISTIKTLAKANGIEFDGI